MAKQKAPAFTGPKRDTSNTKQTKMSKPAKSGGKPMKQCKCGGHG